MDRKESFLEKTSAALDLPSDVVAGMPRIELLGDREFRMEYHKGILATARTRSTSPAESWWCGSRARDWSCDP